MGGICLKSKNTDENLPDTDESQVFLNGLRVPKSRQNSIGSANTASLVELPEH